MSTTAVPAVNTAIYAALTGDAAFVALCPNLYDSAPANPRHPHGVIGDAVEVPDRTFTQDGRIVLSTLSFFTRDGSTQASGRGTTGFAAGLAIAGQAIAVLVNASVAVTGFDVIDIDVESLTTSREADGLTRGVDLVLAFTLEASS